MFKAVISVTRNEFEFVSATTTQATTLAQVELEYTNNVQTVNNVLSAVSDCGEFVELYALTTKALECAFWQIVMQVCDDDDDAEEQMNAACISLHASVR